MNLIKNIEHLCVIPGVEALIVEALAPAKDAGDFIRAGQLPDIVREHTCRGDENWYTTLRGGLAFIAATSETRLRVQLGQHVLVVQRQGPETVALIFPVAHSTGKSIRRTIMRIASKERNPLPAREITTKYDAGYTAWRQGKIG